jgi:acetyl-CoA carboxylase biotin carboxyl carrier protein
MDDLTNEDVADILALLDSLPYDELDLQTARFRLVLRRTPDGWTQSAQSLAGPVPLAGPALAATVPAPEATISAPEATTSAPEATTSLSQRGRPDDMDVTTTRLDAEEGPGADSLETRPEMVAGRELVAVRAPLPGTFYRAPRPGAEPFVQVGSRVGADTVVGIVETMKLMNSVTAGVAGVVAEICVGNGEFAAHGATLVLIEADR